MERVYQINIHRESAQKRKLYVDIGGNNKIDSVKVYSKFGHSCFNCGVDLKGETSSIEKPLDHTLPIKYLWPLTTDNATLLCRECNGEKSDKWPSEFYDDDQLKELHRLTGINYDVLKGDPFFNPAAIKKLKQANEVEKLIEKFAHYEDKVIGLRNRIIEHEGFDFFSGANISKAIIERADAAR
ncbi:hypothetical protein G4V62_18595 [Bacillaceae bacterium SIJ1]|uniref:HNH endonuclease n=1 Tax=Litoribacterium kuwaitense TaxID=1398745 RepID=UPI0013EE1392|nr:hypothetical protein [Litoribacterium kuwaitense]NGP46850.1 hypothetical protein [Litoribacterium kuwaitense]